MSGDVDDYRIRLGFCKVRDTTRFGVETSHRQSLFGRGARNWAVTKIPDAGDHNGGAIVASESAMVRVLIWPGTP